MLYFHLPLKNKNLLKVWIHRIGQKNLPLNNVSRVCSIHFENAQGRLLRRDEYPTLNLPSITTKVHQRKPPAERITVDPKESGEKEQVDDGHLAGNISEPKTTEVGVQTVESFPGLSGLQAQIDALEVEKVELKTKLSASQFRIAEISSNPEKIQFYTGFQNYATLKIFYDSLGPAVNHLNYWGSEITGDTKSLRGRNRSLPPMEEFFFVLVQIRLGLLEKDLAYCFGISISTVSRICITWINFLYIKLREFPLWPKKEIVQAYMPHVFKELYPSTRVIIDATEIFVETPSLLELQQMTFYTYKNHNTYKALVGISPSGAITFVSHLFPGSISDKQLTKRSGLLEMLQPGDSIMADRGFDIQDDVTPLGVCVNIPPFLKGKSQFDASELVETQRIASLRIHVERAMERIKNCHILDRTMPASLTNVAEQIFIVCAILSNFMPPLCMYMINK